jgi:probable HAF family extracellular repeat protein
MPSPPDLPGATTPVTTPGSGIVEYDVVPVPVDGVLYAVNRHGHGAGHAVSPDGTMRAVWFQGEHLVDLGTLGGSASSARGINDDGTIVGGSLLPGDEAHHAFVYAGGVMQDLNVRIAADAGWELVQALSINERGEITAIGHKQGIDQIVVLRPRLNNSI